MDNEYLILLEKLLDSKFSPLKEDVKIIKDHLVILNGKVIYHENWIEINKDDIKKNIEFRKKLAIWGSLIVLFLGFIAPIIRDEIVFLITKQ